MLRVRIPSASLTGLAPSRPFCCAQGGTWPRAGQAPALPIRQPQRFARASPTPACSGPIGPMRKEKGHAGMRPRMPWILWLPAEDQPARRASCSSGVSQLEFLHSRQGVTPVDTPRCAAIPHKPASDCPPSLDFALVTLRNCAEVL